MPLENSKQAIGAVSDLLNAQLSANTSATSVNIGRPETAAANAGPKYNLFLYQINIDEHLRNHALDQGQNPPIWLALHYLLTAFDTDKESDSADAHSLLGEGMLALQELNFLHPNSLALADNPEPLKITFDTADSELLSTVMQGTDEKYRLSAAFQVRPILIAPSATPRYSLPVKSVGPPDAEGVVVLPSLGPRLESVEPQTFVAGSELTITGQDVNASVSEVRLGDQSFAVTEASEGQVKTTIPADTTLSSGSYALCLVRALSGGQTLASDSLIVQLLPQVTGATPGTPNPLSTTDGNVSGDLSLNGTLLGGANDAIYVAFYKDGAVALMLEASGTTAQTSLTVSVSEDDAIPADNYFIIVRVNGAQAADAPEVSWS